MKREINETGKENQEFENLNKEKNYYFPEERPEILTNSVWPKSRMLLSIVSKMFKEGLLNKNQRGEII